MAATTKTFETTLGPISLTPEDRALLTHGLDALLRERSTAYQIAHSAAQTSGQTILSVQDFNLPDILRLSRCLERGDV